MPITLDDPRLEAEILKLAETHRPPLSKRQALFFALSKHFGVEPASWDRNPRRKAAVLASSPGPRSLRRRPSANDRDQTTTRHEPSFTTPAACPNEVRGRHVDTYA